MLAIHKPEVHVSTCVPFHWWPSVWSCPRHPDHNFTKENQPWSFPEPMIPKFWSLGPIRGLLRALPRYHPICTVKKPCPSICHYQQPPEYTSALRSQPWTNVLARPSFNYALRGRIPWWDVANTPSGENSSDKSEFLITQSAKDEIYHSNS